MPIQAIIFDIFGVLSETFNQKWIREHIKDKPEAVEELRTIMLGLDIGTKNQSDFFDAAAKAVGKTPDTIQREMESGFLVYSDIFKIATKLKDRYKTAICSNSSAAYVRPLFQKQGFKLDDYFHSVFISSEIKLMKPEPEIFKYCAERLGVALENCLFIDDAMTNVDAAKKVGMRAYHVTDQKSLEDWLKANF